MSDRIRLNRASRREEQCPDCLDRGALNLVGRPIFYRGAKLTGGCSQCGGTGRAITYEAFGAWPPHDRFYVIPPQELKRREKEEALRAKAVGTMGQPDP